mmetsp:Transcript_5701/g.18539  ORF Transcript_5701/g.18539 Transcript_5701/m.18539 type:complete len:282 (+) Transcript_5701:960-1805(+)
MLRNARNLPEVRHVLRPLGQAVTKVFQGDEAKHEHLRARLTAEAIEHVAQRNTKRLPSHQLVLNERAKQHAGDLQLLLRVLGKEAILVKQVVNHSSIHVLLAGVGRRLEKLEQLENVGNSHLPRVNLVEVAVGRLLDFGGEGLFAANDGGRTRRGPVGCGGAVRAAIVASRPTGGAGRGTVFGRSQLLEGAVDVLELCGTRRGPSDDARDGHQDLLGDRGDRSVTQHAVHKGSAGSDKGFATRLDGSREPCFHVEETTLCRECRQLDSKVVVGDKLQHDWQ